MNDSTDTPPPPNMPHAAHASGAQLLPKWVLPPQYIVSTKVRDADIDDFNHVNNVVYLGWMARTAWEHSKFLGFDFAAFEARDCGFVVTRHEIDYRAAALAGETVHIGTWVSVNDGRLVLRRRFQLLAGDGRELARGMTQFAPMKISTARGMRMHKDYVTGYPQIDGVEAAFAG